MPRRPRPCRCGKQSYGREQAITKAARMQAHPHGQVGHRAIGVYQCELSGGWHVGHRPRVLPKGKDETMTEDGKPETAAVDERPIDATTDQTNQPDTASAEQAAAAPEAAAPAPEPMTLEQLLEQRQPMIHGLAAVAAVAEAATLKFVAEHEHADPRVIAESDVVFTETLRHLLECERMELGKRNQIELMQHQLAMMAAGQNAAQRIAVPPPGMQKLPWRPPVKGNGRH